MQIVRKKPHLKLKFMLQISKILFLYNLVILILGCFPEPTPLEREYEIMEKYKKANVYYEECKYEKAIPLYEETIKMRYLIKDAYKKLGTCYEKIGRDEEAIKVYEKYNVVDSWDVENLENLVRLYEKYGYTEKAVETKKRLADIKLPQK